MELNGKKINFLGDSITEGCCASKPELGFVNVMKANYALAEVRNYGIGGTRIARQQFPSDESKYDLDFCMRFHNMEPDADLILVFGGTNDHGHGDAPFGIETDTTPDTFCGACNYLFSGLKHQYPNSIIVILTPLHRIGENIPKNGYILKDYVHIIRMTALRHELPLLDLYETSTIRAHDPAVAAQLTTDGLHPNDLGHEILAQEIGSFLLSL